jgi:serine/threonine protein kinase
VDENLLLPDAVRTTGPNVPVITDLTGIEEARTLSSSRFGSVGLVQQRVKGGLEYFAAKYYNAGDNKEGLQGFHDRVRGLVSLSHPCVMPIVGLIPPTKTTGPIVLTPYSANGSLSDVFDRVHRNEAPWFWNDAGKLRMIVSLICGFQYLQSQGVVHREVKPSDLIVQDDGTIRICGYLTSILEEHRYTRASQVGAPSYMAPEVYEERENEQKSRDPKTDVFSFALILYELLCGQRVFPPSASAAVIMRRAMSARAADRPVIPNGLHPILRELIGKSWFPAPSKRQSFEAMWTRLRDAGFKVFPTVDVYFRPFDTFSQGKEA